MSQDPISHHIQLRDHAENIQSDAEGQQVIPQLQDLIERLSTGAERQDR
jgi:hypothetical protein